VAMVYATASAAGFDEAHLQAAGGLAKARKHVVARYRADRAAARRLCHYNARLVFCR
jgi:hypothetical protein